MKVYIVIGTIQNVYQDSIGGAFIEHPSQEIVRVFLDEDKAEKFISDSRLAKVKREPYGDTSYYKGGYYEMTVESHYTEDA